MNYQILKELRFEKRLSLGRLAAELNKKYDLKISKGTISRWEAGKSVPSYTNLKCISDYYNVTTDYLLGFDDENGNPINIDPKYSSSLPKLKNSKKNKIIDSISDILNEDIFKPRDLLEVKNYVEFLKIKLNKKNNDI